MHAVNMVISAAVILVCLALGVAVMWREARRGRADDDAFDRAPGGGAAGEPGGESPSDG